MTEECPDDLEPRVAVLEGQMAEVRADAAARVLAAGADRDVSEVRAELRAHLRAINALGQAQRETRLELKAEIGQLRSEMQLGFTETRAGFAPMQAGMAQIVDLLERPDDGPR